MDFQLSREQQDIQKAVREFVKGEFKKEVIDTLIDGALPAGRHTALWKAETRPTGVYFYQLVAEDFVQAKTMTLVK